MWGYKMMVSCQSTKMENSLLVYLDRQHTIYGSTVKGVSSEMAIFFLRNTGHFCYLIYFIQSVDTKRNVITSMCYNR